MTYGHTYGSRTGDPWAAGTWNFGMEPSKLELGSVGVMTIQTSSLRNLEISSFFPISITFHGRVGCLVILSGEIPQPIETNFVKFCQPHYLIQHA